VVENRTSIGGGWGKRYSESMGVQMEINVLRDLVGVVSFKTGGEKSYCAGSVGLLRGSRVRKCMISRGVDQKKSGG